MRKHRKAIFVALAAILVVGATLGAVAFVQADDQNTQTTGSPNNTLLDKVATIYQQNTGVTIDPAELEKAFQGAHQQLADERLDNCLQKLVDADKITQQQAEDYKTWLESRPGTVLSDEYKQWMESKPEGLPFGPGGKMSFGPGERLPAMPRGFNGFGKMFCR